MKKCISRYLHGLDRQFNRENLIRNEYNDNNTAECLQGKARKIVSTELQLEFLG